MNDRIIDLDGTRLREGTSIYDTEYDRVLWVSAITNYEVVVDPATPYGTDEAIGWPTTEEAVGRVGEGTLIGIEEFESLVREGRFEIESQPLVP